MLIHVLRRLGYKQFSNVRPTLTFVMLKIPPQSSIYDFKSRSWQKINRIIVKDPGIR